MAPFHSFTLFAIIIKALLTIASPSVQTHSKSSSTLYCVSDPTTQHITTLNSSAPEAQCFRVENGIFSEVLSSIPSTLPSDTVYLDGFVLPGIIESHGHLLQYGEMLDIVSLYGAESMAEVRERIKNYLVVRKGEGHGSREKWVRGIGWDQKYFGGVMPTAEELGADAELKDLYIMVDRVDVHCSLVSQKVLDLLPNPLPEAPPGGMIVTDPGPGVFCDNAMEEIVLPIAPHPDAAQKQRWFQTGMAGLNEVGITTIGNAGMRAEDVQILERLVKNGETTVRISMMLECAIRNEFCYDEVKDLDLVKEKELGGEMLILGGVKLFADGALGSFGAALLEPYSDNLETSGTMLINETDLTDVVEKWFKAGIQVNVHAIGDRANRAAIDAFENVLGKDCEGCNNARRLRIEHAQIIHPDDQKRIFKMGIIPSIQPTHATSDMAYAVSRLGPTRLARSAYRMASFFDTTTHPDFPGAVLGSDFPVEPANPFQGMYAAVTRLNPATGTSPSGDEGWYPEEKLSVGQALRGFTRNGAYGIFKEGALGAIEVGKWADWVVVDRNVLQDSTGKSLRDVEVRETWVAGRKVFPVVAGAVGDGEMVEGAEQEVLAEMKDEL